MKYKTVIFVASYGHSGSTLLDFMLGTHSQCISLGEFNHMRPYRNGKGKPCCLCTTCCPVLQKYYNTHVSKHKHINAFHAFNTSYLIDSSKFNGWILQHIKWIDQNKGYDYRVVRITRYGLGQLLKNKRKTGRLDKKFVGYMRKVWKTSNKLMAALPANKTLQVKYEDLCKNTEPTLQKCCSFIGIDYETQMRQYWTVPRHVVLANQKPIWAIALHLGLRDLSSMKPEIRDFYSRYDYRDIKLDQRYLDAFTDKEKASFLKHCGKLMEKNGYGSYNQELLQSRTTNTTK